MSEIRIRKSATGAVSSTVEDTGVETLEHTVGEPNVSDTARRPTGLPKIGSIILIGMMFLLPIFFVPILPVTLEYAKMLVFAVGILGVFCFWVISRLKHGEVSVPYNWVILSACGVVVAYLVSAILSQTPAVSLIGRGSEIDTASFIALGSLGLFLAAAFFRSKSRIFYAYAAFLAAFFILALYHGFRLVFGPEFLSFGIFTSDGANSVGTLNHLAVFSGLIGLISLVTLELVSLTKGLRYFVWTILGISLIFVGIINFAHVWYALGAFALVLFIYLLSFRQFLSIEPKGKSFLPIASLVVILVAFAAILAGDVVRGVVSPIFNFSVVEVRPSWGSTYEVAKQVFKQNPVFGSGPSFYSAEWLSHKPDGINETIFWDTDFNYGVGFIPSSLTTVGIVGALAWLAFLGSLIYTGFKVLFTRAQDAFSRYLALSSFLASLYLWTFCFFYIPSITTFVITFLVTGIFLAAAALDYPLKEKVFNFADSPKISFISVLSLVLSLILVIAWGYAYVKEFTAAAYWEQSARVLARGGNIDEARGFAEQAAAFTGDDVYYRLLTQINMLQLNGLLSQQDISEDTLRARFQELTAATSQNALLAVNANRYNYQNWLILGQFYETFASYKIPEASAQAYAQAQSAYNEALKLNPENPAIHLFLARLEATNEKVEDAKKHIEESLKLKPNYTDAYFLLSQIQVAEGKTKDAIVSVEAATNLNPNNQGLYFQLGLLRYSDENYNGAIAAFERAIDIDSQYANARYFLGLSYEANGRTNDAIVQFEEIMKTNPNNKEVTLILSNLKSGKEPFANAQPPIDSTPEDREELPIEE